MSTSRGRSARNQRVRGNCRRAAAPSGDTPPGIFPALAVIRHLIRLVSTGIHQSFSPAVVHTQGPGSQGPGSWPPAMLTMNAWLSGLDGLPASHPFPHPCGGGGRICPQQPDQGPHLLDDHGPRSERPRSWSSSINHMAITSDHGSGNHQDDHRYPVAKSWWRRSCPGIIIIRPQR
jgi:hypothetical protein